MLQGLSCLFAYYFPRYADDRKEEMVLYNSHFSREREQVLVAWLAEMGAWFTSQGNRHFFFVNKLPEWSAFMSKTGIHAGR